MSKSIQCLLCCLLGAGFVALAESASAAAGSLDPTFGQRGVTISTAGGIPYSIKLQPDGKILILANTGAGSQVLRYTFTGTLDTTFGSKGIATLPKDFNTFASMALQSNGQIVVAGGVSAPSNNAAAFGLERLNPNGAPDTTFGSNDLAVASLGFPGTEAVLLIQPNGAILLGAQLEPTGRRQPFHTALARFDATGALDTTFGSGGTVSVPAVGGCSALALLSTGEILVVNGTGIAQF
ncbi:MAG: hypothetical protein JO232_15835, partial [Verrucomicrobia bacterium]|nr:hypothetical protein [Verrucomicrobiota bacterium]